MPSSTRTIVFCFAMAAAASGFAATKHGKNPEPTPLDRYIQEALSRPASPGLQTTPGSLWTPSSRLTALPSDLRASQVDDLVTVLVVESASAVVQGATKAQRQSNLKASVTALNGIKNPVGSLANLANVSSASQLDGSGATTRSTQLNTILSARISHVLPNGYLVVEGSKEVVINSERQVVTVRGVVRPIDLTTENIVRSDQIAQMELKVNGKGVVGDAIRRPFILYRLLMGLLPF